MTNGSTHTKIWLYLPNSLTVLRLLASPITFYLILNNKLVHAFFVFACAGITDLIDGYLARKWQAQSRFGQIFDPLADKSLMLVCFIALAMLGYTPLWFLSLMISRDIVILLAGLSILVFKLPIKLRPSFISKVNTTLQLLYIGSLLLNNPDMRVLSAVLNPFSHALMVLTVITTIWSGYNYSLYFVRQMVKVSGKISQ